MPELHMDRQKSLVRKHKTTEIVQRPKAASPLPGSWGPLNAMICIATYKCGTIVSAEIYLQLLIARADQVLTDLCNLHPPSQEQTLRCIKALGSSLLQAKAYRSQTLLIVSVKASNKALERGWRCPSITYTQWSGSTPRHIHIKGAANTGHAEATLQPPPSPQKEAGP